MCETDYLGGLGDESCSVDSDYNKKSSILKESFTSPQLVLDGHLYPEFGSLSTNKFMIQDFTLFHQKLCMFQLMRFVLEITLLVERLSE